MSSNARSPVLLGLMSLQSRPTFGFSGRALALRKRKFLISPRLFYRPETGTKSFGLTLRTMDVTLVRWPADEAKRLKLADRSRPRLLIVDSKAKPPASTDVLEDWVRLPVSAADAKARVRRLEARVNELTPHIPFLDSAGAVEYRSARVGLSPLQARLMTPLIDRFDTVANRQTLAQVGWPDGTLRPNTLDVHMMRLRRRLESLGLQIRTVRSRGFLLADADSDF